MTLATRLRQWAGRSPEDAAAQPLLAGYRRSSPRMLRYSLIALLAIACLIYGLAFGTVAPSRMMPFAVPLALLFGLILWCLPAGEYAPTRVLEPVFLAFFAALLLWPNYLAVAIGNLPWMTVLRLTGIPLVTTLLACISISKTFRTTLSNILAADKVMTQLVVALVGLWTFSLLLSRNPGMSINHYILTQLNLTGIFFVSCYLFSRKGFAEFWVRAFLAILAFICVLGIWESRIQHLPWAGHIPSFLKIDDPLVQKLLTPKISRELIYRVKVTATTPLGLAELLGLSMPFAIHFLLGSYRLFMRGAVALYIPAAFLVILHTDSRLGVVSAFASGLFYVLVWAVLMWRQQKNNLIAPAIVLSYPALFAAFMAATFAVPQLRYKFWGRGSQQASTQGRIDQWEQGIPKIISHPFGHGIGQASPSLGWSTPGGTITIDSYWLSVLLEIGILGFLVFYGLMLRAAFVAARTAITLRGQPETTLLLPMSVSLITFVIVKLVFSQESNHPLIFMILGAVLALTYRARQYTDAKAVIAPGVSAAGPRPAHELISRR